MKHPSRWRSNTLRRLFLIVAVPFVYTLGLFVGMTYGVKEVFSELTDSVIKIWKRPN